MLRYFSCAALIGWLIYSWPIALGIVAFSLFIAMFYAGCIDGKADEKVEKTLCFTIIVVSILALGAFGTRSHDDSGAEYGAPKMCMHVQC